jgi:hypothetical protein
MKVRVGKVNHSSHRKSAVPRGEADTPPQGRNNFRADSALEVCGNWL